MSWLPARPEPPPPPAWRPRGQSHQEGSLAGLGYDHPVLPKQARSVPVLLRGGATAVAAGRVALGLTALAFPSVPARPWVGAGVGNLAVRVFGRALGARDVALGLGALAALRRPGAAGPARAWVAAGALSDALDVAATVSSWRELPRSGRWLVAVSAGGAALVGAAGARALPGTAPGGDPDTGIE